MTSALLVLVAVATLASPLGAAGQRTATAANPIQAENARAGTTAWAVRQAPAGMIDAYTSEVSAAPGSVVHLHVATEPAARYRVEIYRLGWYGGKRGRLIGCVPACRGFHKGAVQTSPGPDSGNGILRLDWPVTETIPIGSDWTSGYYYLDVVLVGGPAAGTGRRVPLIVLAPRDRPTAILAQASVNTWQAYNAWGGMSLYTKPGTLEGSHVSFDRPYDTSHQGLESWELSAVTFLERYGYDVSYTTDVDTDRDPAGLLKHALVMTLGHDEYWTHEMRDAFERARDAGISLAFLGANNGYWQIRYENERRTLVEYRHPDLDPEPNPALKTTTFRELIPRRPECDLFGVQYGQIGDSQDFTINPDVLTDAWFANTGFTATSTLHGLVGYEWDGVQAGCTSSVLTVFFHDEHLNGSPPVEGTRWNSDVIRYTAPSGARVFAGGSLQFAWGLDPFMERYDARLDRFMRNGLDDLTRPAPPVAVATTAVQGTGVVVAPPAAHNAQVQGIVVFRHRGAAPFGPTDPGVVSVRVPRCTAFLDRPGRGVFRYAVAYASRWRTSLPTLGAAVVYRSATPAPQPGRAGRCVRALH